MRRKSLPVCLTLTLMLCLLLAVGTVEAKGSRLVANWNHEVYSLGTPEFLQDKEVHDAITLALTEKLRSLDKAGKLPFELNEKNDESMNATREDYTDAMPIGLVPMMMLDKSFRRDFHIGDDSYYTDILAASLMVAVVSGDDESHTQRLLAVVPISGHTMMGNIDHPIQQPITKAEEKEAFIKLVTQMIDQKLDFSGTSKALKDWEVKQVWPDTYQVNEIAISSQGANAVFASAQQKSDIKAIIGNFYTSAYQRKTRNIVLPPVTAEDAMTKIDEGLYACEVHSLSGAAMVSFTPPKHPIKLDFCGVNSADVPQKKESYVQRTVAYKAWLRRTMDGQDLTMDDYMTVTLPKTNDRVSFTAPEDDIYTELMIGLTNKLANAKG